MLSEILKKCSMLEVVTERSNSNGYVELVIYKKEMELWSDIISGILGAAVKPAGASPTKEDLSLTKEYGGIRDGQTLFYCKFDEVPIVAMFWPWGNGEYVTLRMVCSQN